MRGAFCEAVGVIFALILWKGEREAGGLNGVLVGRCKWVYGLVKPARICRCMPSTAVLVVVDWGIVNCAVSEAAIEKCSTYSFTFLARPPNDDDDDDDGSADPSLIELQVQPK